MPDFLINGKRVEELGMVELAHVKEQMPAFKETDYANRVGAIRARYPKATVAYLESRIRECEENAVRIGRTKSQQQNMIADYSGHIRLCEHRDAEIAKLDEGKDAGVIRALKKQFPPYDVAALRHQITLCKEAIERADVVIAQEYQSKADLSAARGLAERRDSEIRALQK